MNNVRLTKDNTGEQKTLFSWITKILGFSVMTDSEKEPGWCIVFSKLSWIREEFETTKSMNQILFIGTRRPQKVGILVDN